MRFGGFQFALLALALSACADSDRPIAGFDTVTVEIPPHTTQATQTAPTASQIGNVEPAVAPPPARKPAQTAVAKAPSQPKRQARASHEARPAPAPKRLARKEPAREEPASEARASATLTPQDAVLRPEPESELQLKPQATKPAQPAMVQEDAQGRTTITPRMPSARQTTICKDAPQAVCRGLAECAWVDTYTIGPGVYVDGFCESK